MKVEMIRPKLSCAMCGNSLDVRMAVLDEYGKTVHQDCYLESITEPVPSIQHEQAA